MSIETKGRNTRMVVSIPIVDDEIDKDILKRKDYLKNVKRLFTIYDENFKMFDLL